MSDVTRRDFLKGSAAITGGLVVGCKSANAPPGSVAADPETSSFDAWINITQDDRIVLMVDKVEMGQGTFTAFATLVGEELGVDPQRIEVMHAHVDGRYGGGGIQGTGGSNSLSSRMIPLREAAARTRMLLEQAAANRLAVPVEEIVATDGIVSHAKSGRQLSYGELAEEAAKLRAPRRLVFRDAKDYRWVGKSHPRVDGAAKSRGEAKYGIDTRLPGMRTAVVVRPPHAGDRIRSFADDKVRTMAGVSEVFEIETGVAIVADNYWNARQAAYALEVEIEPGNRTHLGSAEIRSEQTQLLREESGKTIRKDGNTKKAIANADQVVEAEYFTSHQAHATMEPMNCTIDPSDDKIDVYLGTQAPGVVRDVVAGVMGRPRDEVIIHTALLGGGFGRRFFVDVPYEAAQIAKRTDGPIKLVYSREDDMSRDYYRPATGHRFRASLDREGQPTGWEHRLVAPSLMGYMAPNMAGALGPEWMRGFMNSTGESAAKLIPRMMGPILAHEGAENHPYDVPNVRVESILHDPGISVGIWRSVGHSNNGFVVESFIDELAHAAGRDPVQFRHELLSEHPRHRACLDLVTEKAGWDDPNPAVHRGVAVHEAFGTVVAQVAEVAIEAGEIRVKRVVCAVHCGVAVNPDIVRAQLESGIVFGLTAALKSEVTFEDGIAVQTNFDRFKMLRMNEAPNIEVHIVPSTDAPTGVGEPGTPPIAAAVGNAVFVATGVRLRELPLRLPASA